MKRRSKLSGAYLAEYDRALAWARLPTAEKAPNGTSANLKDRDPVDALSDWLEKRLTAPWRSGYAAACKAVYTGSIPVGAFGSGSDFRLDRAVCGAHFSFANFTGVYVWQRQAILELEAGALTPGVDFPGENRPGARGNKRLTPSTPWAVAPSPVPGEAPWRQARQKPGAILVLHLPS